MVAISAAYRVLGWGLLARVGRRPQVASLEASGQDLVVAEEGAGMEENPEEAVTRARWPRAARHQCPQCPAQAGPSDNTTRQDQT